MTSSGPLPDRGRPAAGPSRSWHRGRTPLIIVLFVVGVTLLVGGVMGVVDRGSSRSGEGTVAAAPVAADPALIRLEQQVDEQPDDAQAWAALGAAYVDHARLNSDPSAYPKAERALDRSLDLDDDGNWEALAAQAALAAGRHDFGPALRFGEQARELQPRSSFILGVVVDSLTELGRYPEAVEATQAMVDIRPDLSSYARVSYQRELHGDVDGAIEAMEAALRASAAPGDQAFAAYYLGELEWNRGDVDGAEAHYETALRLDPTALQALAGLGKVAAARGDVPTAIEHYREAVEGFPDPDALKELGELYLLTDDRTRAEEQFVRSAEENAKQAAGGVHVDLELALFSADHRRDLDEGLAAARREWGRRQSIHVADAVAWQLFAHGEYEEALVYADRALQLGTASASFHFHRAEIHRALADTDAALRDYERALELNPNFSFLHAAAAADALAELSD